MEQQYVLKIQKKKSLNVTKYVLVKLISKVTRMRILYKSEQCVQILKNVCQHFCVFNWNNGERKQKL